MTRNLTKAIIFDAESNDFELRLGDELIGWARTYQEGETRLNELVYDILHRAQPVIDTALPVSAEAVDQILEQRETEAQQEQVRAEALDDAEAMAYAAAQRKAIGRARGYVARASRAGRSLVSELLTGGWQIVGSKGDLYTVTRTGLTLSCSCPHGDQLRAAVAAALKGHEQAPPRGVCWHTVLVPAIEEAQERELAARAAELDTRPAPLALAA